MACVEPLLGGEGREWMCPRKTEIGGKCCVPLGLGWSLTGALTEPEEERQPIKKSLPGACGWAARVEF